MRIGIPREVKPFEGRVALIPEAASELVERGHEVWVEHDAGRLSGYSDEDYRALGVGILPDAQSLYGRAELIIKVKEPTPEELPLLRKDHRLFCFLHLAANIELACNLKAIGLTAIAFETVEENGMLPLLAPMSDIAGRIAVQVGTHLLHLPMGGRGILLGGLAAAERGKVVVLGAGNVGGNAAVLAAALGAEVTVFDRKREKLERMRALGNNVTALYPYRDKLARELAEADLFVGAVLIPGARAPRLVSAEMVRHMRPGSVVVDVSVDQGGCVETTRPTTYEQPTYTWEGVIHFAVTNMPGAVPRSASQALSAALIPYALRLAEGDGETYPPLAKGIQVKGGAFVHPALQKLADEC